MNNKEYFLGLDMGTGSVGWSVTDTEYNLIKINRKKAWGCVLFDTSEGAKTRRLNRCARRRLKRQKQRLQLLRELFEDEIAKVDAGFFHRLQESRYVFQDKQDENGLQPQLPYGLFVDKEYTDIDYHKEFPTIYHLRKALMMEDRQFDVRLVYLAISHILKHRGHFLANFSTHGKTNLNFENMFNDLLHIWNLYREDEQEILSVDSEKICQIEKIMKDSHLTKTNKKQALIALWDNPAKEWKELCALLVGGKVTLSKIFDKKEYEALEENKICFDEAAYEEKEEYYATNLEDDFEVIGKAKVIYDWMVLSELLRGNKEGLLSLAKVQTYEKHKKDLRILKDAIAYDFEGSEQEKIQLRKKTFGISKKDENNYSSYIGMCTCNGKKREMESKKCIANDFYKFINKNVLPKLKDGERKSYIEKEIELKEFMPKARVKENAVIPYQLHQEELNRILKKAQKYLPFLLEKDKNGLSVSEKIMQLLTFRIPYYVGPVNIAHEHAWAERKETGRITPWNFEQKIDVEESAKAFIERMTSKCTYLKQEDVLPKGSLLYEKYMVLNEINKLTIQSEKIDVKLKQRIYKNLFERHLKVTVKKLLDYLKREEGYTDITKEDIGGLDVEIKSSLKSYHAFKREFTGVEISENIKEDIIRDMTLFGAEPTLLKKRLVQKYPSYEKQMVALIKSLKCNEWGRLSYKLLNGIAVDISGQGKIGTIIYQMWETNQNLMELLTAHSSPYAKLIQEENKQEMKNEISYEMIEDLYVAPAVKRQIWKAVQITQEITKAMGHPPKRVFVEMAREHQESKRSVTRKDRLVELYKSIKEENELLEQLKDTPNDKLRADKLYLYYTQMGRCAYTGKLIDFDKLNDKNIYDIDHIYPQSKTADDSLDNRVLVCKEENENKSDIYPIKKEIRDSMRDTWAIWYKKGLISEKKYKRLIRTTELTPEELMGFINRQLVETRQSTKEFMSVLKQILPKETEIVYSKAGNVVNFRQHFKILKIRELNDLHHAKDAYLNIVVGNVYHLKFTKDIRKYFMENGTYRTYNLERMFDFDVNYKDEMAWRKGKTGTIKKVKETLKCDRVLVTKQVYERKGQLFKVQPVKKGKGQVALKSNAENERLADIGKYGGYKDPTITYFSLIKGENKKGKTEVYIASVPLYLSKKIEQDENYAKEYFEKEYRLSDVQILRKKIRMQTLMVCEGFYMRIAGKSDKQIIVHNANQLTIEEKYQKVLKEISKFMRERQEKTNAVISQHSNLNQENMLEVYDCFQKKLEETIYHEMLGRYVDVLEKGRKLFCELPLEEQAIQIYELRKLFTCTPEMPDISRIGGSKKSGAIRISMNVTKRKNLAFIHQSVTGLYEQIERVFV